MGMSIYVCECECACACACACCNSFIAAVRRSCYFTFIPMDLRLVFPSVLVWLRLVSDRYITSYLSFITVTITSLKLKDEVYPMHIWTDGCVDGWMYMYMCVPDKAPTPRI